MQREGVEVRPVHIATLLFACTKGRQFERCAALPSPQPWQMRRLLTGSSSACKPTTPAADCDPPMTRHLQSQPGR